MRRMNDIHLHTIQTIAVIELVHRLTLTYVLGILFFVFWQLIELVPCTSPHANLHFIMCITRAGIEDVDVAV
jgi:hypothetical protein